MSENGMSGGLHRRQLGDVVVTAVSDGGLTLPPEVLQGIEPQEVEAALLAAGRTPPFVTSINAYLLQWPGRTVLVDTGSGPLIGPSAGKLLENLEAAGVAPDDVDAVLLTHLHIDHVGGLVDAAGAPVFGRADLLVRDEELDFWRDDAAMQAAPEARRSSFDLARRATAAYGARLQRYTGEAPLPGIEAVALPGHTPGHTGYAIGSGAEQLLIWGDVVHVADVQAPRPEVTLVFDSNPAQAADSRRRILDRAASDGLLVAGMHLAFPGFARVVRSAEAYAVQAG